VVYFTGAGWWVVDASVIENKIRSVRVDRDYHWLARNKSLEDFNVLICLIDCESVGLSGNCEIALSTRVNLSFIGVFGLVGYKRFWVFEVLRDVADVVNAVPGA
jgi:hypothetical protein